MSDIISISGSTVTINGAGTVYITATQSSSDKYTEANIVSELTISKATPTLIKPFELPTNKNELDEQFTIDILLAPQTNSDGLWNYYISNSQGSLVTSNVATITDNNVIITSSGQVYIVATQQETANFTSFTTEPVLLNIKAIPNITSVNIPSNKVYLNEPFEINIETNSDGFITYITTDINGEPIISSVISIQNNVVSILGAGEAYIKAIISETFNFTSKISEPTLITIAKAQGLIDTVNDITINYGSEPVSITPTTNNTDFYTFTFSSTSHSSIININNNVISFLDNGTALVNIFMDQTSNYTSATSSFTINVLPINPSLGAFNISNVTFSPTQEVKQQITPPTSTNTDGTWSFSIVDSNGDIISSDIAYINGQNELVVTNAGIILVKAVQQSIYGFNEISATTTFTVNKYSTPIYGDFNLPANIKYLNNTITFTEPLTYSDGQWIYYVSDSDGNIINDTSIVSIVENVATINKVGEVYITAKQLASRNYVYGLKTSLLTIGKSNSTLGNLILPSDKKYLNEPFNLTQPTTNNVDSNGLWSYYVSDIAGNSINNSNVISITIIL